MRTYFYYSFILHSLVIFFVGFLFLRSSHLPTYYSVDFLGGIPSRGGGGGESVAQPKEEPKEEAKTEVKEEPAQTAKIAAPPVSKKSSEILVSEKKKKDDLKIKKSNVSAVGEQKKGTANGSPTGQTAKKGSGKGTGGGGEGTEGAETGTGVGGIFTTGDFPYAWYLNRIKQKLLENWNPPGYYKDQTTAQVKFLVQRDGKITDVEIEKSSGDGFFDQSALRTVIYSDPLPPLPLEYPENKLGIHVRFVGKMH
ncbi:MAG: TonB family protein [Elusimicrobiota bacterium]